MQFNVIPRTEMDFTIIHSAVTLNEVFLLFQATGPLTFSPVQVTIFQLVLSCGLDFRLVSNDFLCVFSLLQVASGGRCNR